MSWTVNPKSENDNPKRKIQEIKAAATFYSWIWGSFLRDFMFLETFEIPHCNVVVYEVSCFLLALDLISHPISQ